MLYAQEREEPKHRPRVDWKLITNLPEHTHDDAIGKLDWYGWRDGLCCSSPICTLPRSNCLPGAELPVSPS
ncbi:hypothetical protein GCM10010869_49340 [Mesorhizobium tianshanense]|nr:hypothetical protein GCM10010869_49340 [Mesorhizobium tianshanense]